MLGAAPAEQAPAGTHAWAQDVRRYPLIDPVATADRVITYEVNLSGFRLFAAARYDPADIQPMAEAVRRAFEKWNEVVEPLGLAFREASDAEPAEVSVRALPYDAFIPDALLADSVALSLGLPYRHVYVLLPIWFDTTEDLADLADRPVIADRLLSHPYLKLVADGTLDIYSVTLHEIGHVLGLGHVDDALRGGYNYNFLGLPSVHIDSACLTPSNWVAGLDAAARGTILEVEVPSIMIPVSPGTIFAEIPPEDRATAAFVLRSLHPEGADEMLRQAGALYRQSSPLRFANVVYERERSSQAERNDTIETAMAVQPGRIVLGSLLGASEPDEPLDKDVFRLELTAAQVGRSLHLDIDEAGGLPDLGASHVRLSLLDERGETIASGHPVGEPDEDSYSGLDPILLWPIERAGVYYITVEPAEEGTPGTYVLKIGLDEEVQPTGQHDPPIETSGSEGCRAPVDRLTRFVCPGVGFSVLPVLGLAAGLCWRARSPTGK